MIYGRGGAEDYKFHAPESTGEYHDVYFKKIDGTVIERLSVLDGNCLKEFPDMDKEMYSGWYFWYLDGWYSNLRPVYEDTVLYARPVFE